MALIAAATTGAPGHRVLTLAVIGGYLLITVLIGILSNRFLRRTGEDYFVATRTIGPFVLFMSLFGTNMTAFALLGSSGETYLEGIGVFGLMASSSALVIPCVLFFVGTRLWALGKQHGYITQVQYFRDRWESNGLGLVIFVLLVFFSIPYILTGIMGGNIVLARLTGLDIGWGGLAVCLAVLTYTFLGGMRGANWAQTFQACLLLAISVLAFFVITHHMGGFATAMNAVVAAHPDRLVRGRHIPALQFWSYTLIPLSVGMFPHMFIHLLTARRLDTFKYTFVFYPICIAIIWLPCVLLGLLATAQFHLPAEQSNGVLLRMYARYAPMLSGLFGAAVCAAVMGSLDSHTLCLGSMFTQDVVVHYNLLGPLSERGKVYTGRFFVIVLLAGVLITSIVYAKNRTIFSTAVWCFSAFSAMFPVLLAALFWKRSTKYGVFASMLSVAVLIPYFYIKADFGRDHRFSIGGTGLMPVAVILVISALALVLVSWVTPAPSRATIAKFFPEAAAPQREPLAAGAPV